MEDGHYVDIWQIGDFFFIEVAEYTSGPFYFDAIVMGKLKEKSIGPLVDSEDVAQSLKGSMLVWDGFLLGPDDQDISGTSNILIKLNTSGTKWANGDNDESEIKTQNEVVAEAIDYLEDKGFSEAELP